MRDWFAGLGPRMRGAVEQRFASEAFYNALIWDAGVLEYRGLRTSAFR